jgi:phosphopantothenoylcysteine decarboxylase/phosphopantothenate--cysteine ligase
MRDAVLAFAGDADALVSAAAISDYTVAAAPEKLRSGRTDLTLDLEPTPKLLDAVRETHPELAIVGFKAETEGDDADVAARARELLDRTDCAFVVGNHADVMGAAETRAVVVDEDAVDRVAGSKADLGARVAARLADHLRD